ncbi:MAG: tRNA uridine-5-carboxymethylaminomethyl(34) synthesis GTPase MnmE [Bacillota bacterium]
MFDDTDTIVAVSTAPGEAGIGLIRMSGPDAAAICRRVFRTTRGRRLRSLESHRVYYGQVCHPVTGEPVDEVLVTFMGSPRSYTREDVVEVGCHGGVWPMRRVLQLLVSAGARLAGPGEFTRRAFVNGRIDLAQAEAVCEVIRARSEAALKQAMQQLEGALSRRVRELSHDVVGLTAAIAASVDFPEYDVEEISRRDVRRGLEQVLGEVRELLRRAGEGRVVREGVRTVIAGKPNVGKSALLNAIVGRERAIVTPVAGTTRDVIEEAVVVRGVSLVVADTAGIRHTEDAVEQQGVERAQRAIAEADLLLAVFDDSRPLDQDDTAVADLALGRVAVAVVNKVDLRVNAWDESRVRTLLGTVPLVRVSAATGEGLDQLFATIHGLFIQGELASTGPPLVAGVRHITCLQTAATALEAALAGVDGGHHLDLVAVDLHDAAQALGEITGESVDENILDRIFKDFCIGK